MPDADFVAGVLAGFEGTLDEVIGRVASPERNADLAVRRFQVPVHDTFIVRRLKSGADLGGNGSKFLDPQRTAWRQ